MPLSAYHQKYLNRSPQDLALRIRAKESCLQQVLETINFKAKFNPVKIAIMGCGVKYFVPVYKQIFAKILATSVDITTFDISIEHLQGEEGVVQHDCTLPLPNGPYDISISDILLKFIGTEKQWNVLENSYTVLREGGIAIHYVGNEEGETKDVELGYNHVPFARWREEFKKHNINFKEIPIKTGPLLTSDEIAWVLFK